MPEERVDVAGLVEDIKSEVTRKRAAHEYPDDLLEKLRLDFHPDDLSLPPEALVQIQSARSLQSSRPGIGKLIVFFKKAMRRMLFWYVHPITVDQTRFNIAITREMRKLQKRVEELERNQKS